MKAKLVIIIGLLIAQSGYAASLLDFWKAPQDNFKTSQVLDQDGACTDFSGQWEGTCKFKDQTHEISQTVKQMGCYGIHYNDGGFYFIDGVKNESHISPTYDEKGNFALSSTGSLSWNKDKTALQLVYSISTYQMGEMTSSKTIYEKGEMKIVDSQLIAKFEIGPDVGVATCQLNKVK